MPNSGGSETDGTLMSKWKVVHTRRERNCVVYELAQQALRFKSSAVWCNVLPPFHNRSCAMRAG
jgi:hypothetical protein